MQTEFYNEIKNLLDKSQSVATAVISEPCSLQEFSSLKDRTEPKDNDDSFAAQNIKDRITNRDQRIKISRKVFFMMVCEVSVVGFLLLGLFSVPYINALVPKISINMPPLFLSFSIILGYCLVVKYIDLIPNFYTSCKRMHLRKICVNISAIIKVLCLILIFVVLNILPRKHYILNFQQIELSEAIINLILYTALAVFCKTAFLGHYIIKALYDLMKNHKLN